MNHETILDSLGRLPEDVIGSVDAVRSRKKQKPVWLKWGALAACLCVVAVIAVPVFRHRPEETPMDHWFPNDSGVSETFDDGSTSNNTPDTGAPSLTVDGKRYIVSPYFSRFKELPEGFVYAGEISEDCSYYTNPDMPEWIYTYSVIDEINKVDATGAVVGTIPVYGYKRYVEERLRGRDLVCYNGEYYISLWSAEPYGDKPDVSRAYYDAMIGVYGPRLEGDPPYGFELVGIAEFSGYDTIPRGELACNVGVRNIYKTGVMDVLLVSNVWTSQGKTCRGFDVYVRYDCPFA